MVWVEALLVQLQERAVEAVQNTIKMALILQLATVLQVFGDKEELEVMLLGVEVLLHCLLAAVAEVVAVTVEMHQALLEEQVAMAQMHTLPGQLQHHLV